MPRPESSVISSAVEKPGLKNQRQGFAFGEAGRFFRRQQALCDRALANLGRVDSAAIIGDLDHDLIALMIGVEPAGALRTLAGARAFLRRFNAVAHRVAQNMHERLGERVEDAFVKIGVRAFHDQLNFLAPLASYVTNGSRKAAEELIDRNHSDLHDGMLEVAKNARLKGHDVAEPATKAVFWEALPEFDERLLQHGFR